MDHATLLSLLGALAKLCKSCCTHASNNDLWRAMCGARGWLPHLEQTTFSTVVAEHHSRTKKEKKRGVGALILAQKLSAWYSPPPPPTPPPSPASAPPLSPVSATRPPQVLVHGPLPGLQRMALRRLPGRNMTAIEPSICEWSDSAFASVAGWARGTLRGCAVEQAAVLSLHQEDREPGERQCSPSRLIRPVGARQTTWPSHTYTS